MSRFGGSLLLSLALVLGAACELHEEVPRLNAPAEREVTPASLFPLAVGDRWRERTHEGTARTRGVTAHTSTGLAVIFGQGESRPAFHRADEREAALVDPAGRRLEPLLKAPIRAGARFEYSLGEGEGAARCEASVVETGARERVGGAEIGGCVRLERRCVHPPGVVFERETVRRSEETYCPRIGRVRARQELEPPLPDAVDLGPSMVELVGFRVAGGPRTPPGPRFGCDEVLLLPSDVQAACGADWGLLGEEELESGCVHRFSRGEEGALELRLMRHPDAADARAALDALMPDAAPSGELRTRAHEDAISMGATEGEHVIVLDARGCAFERAAQLLPLARSLVAR